jgi:hypothetical protein
VTIPSGEIGGTAMMTAIAWWEGIGATAAVADGLTMPSAVGTVPAIQ